MVVQFCSNYDVTTTNNAAMTTFLKSDVLSVFRTVGLNKLILCLFVWFDALRPRKQLWS